MAEDFQRIQRQLADYLRDPEGAPAPAGLEPRRLAIYRELVYNNIESFLANGFPVLRAITPEPCWHAMTRDFIRVHRCDSPYFLHIGREFLRYLETGRGEVRDDPPFLRELAHYEWVELDLDIASAKPPDAVVGDPLGARLRLSPLARNLEYRFPVHRIGPNYQPDASPTTPTHLLVYRDKADRVRFMEINGPTSRLVALLAGGELTGNGALGMLAVELGHSDASSLAGFGAPLLADLVARGILLPA